MASMNAVPVSGIDYAPDPHGSWLFHGLSDRIARSLNNSQAIHERSGTWFGWTPTVQQFRGAAGLSAGKPIAPASATISDQKSTQDSVVSDIFRSRFARGIRG